ncbi:MULTISPECIES: HAD family hydrolase [unclassified Streptomyces]|uniref:HAD family hydrolase n=1 Tax=unclassified Streptomyces TaxID=2593676 RepID=UPI0037FC0E87
MPIRAVLWDIDDTIFDYSAAERAGVLTHLRNEGLLSAFEDEYGEDGENTAVARWHAVMNLHYERFLAGEITWAEQRRERVRAFLGPDVPDAAADSWFAAYYVHFEAAWAVFPDVVPALDALTPGYRHGLLSNSATAHQERKLARLGLRNRFECLLCSQELGFAKPAPEAFLAACEALGLPPAEVAYVGDKADTDARGANAAGLHGVWLDRTGSVTAPDLRRITGLAQLPALLAADTRFGAPSSIG